MGKGDPLVLDPAGHHLDGTAGFKRQRRTLQNRGSAGLTRGRVHTAENQMVDRRWKRSAA